MKVSSLIPACLCALSASAASAIVTEPLPSVLLPPVGQTVQYRFSDSVTTSKGMRTLGGTLTLRTVAEDQIHATVAIDGKESRDFDFHLDDTGALRPATSPDSVLSSSGKPRNKRQNEPAPSEQALRFQLLLAARVCARPVEGASFPVLLDVPWARGPVNPTLRVQSTGPGTFTADAEDATEINPPHNGRPHIVRTLATSIGIGIVATEVGGTAGRIIGPTFTAGSLLYATQHRPAPLPIEVTLHFDGQMADGRLKTLSADQRYTVQVQKHTRTISDKWTLTAE
jgi:hypothetical protein